MKEVIVVTGASAGLGRAIVRRFARDGAAIGLIARGRERLEQTAFEVESLGGRALMLPLDVADADAVEAAAARVEAELGPIDVWINNAMVSVYSPIKQMSAAEFRRVTEVTYLGYVHGTLADAGDEYAAVRLGEEPAAPAAPTGAAIYQPEVGADAVHHAVRHDVGREFLVSWSTIKAVVGEKLVPAYIDRDLGRSGYAAEETRTPAEPDRPDNLWHPVSGDFAAHGRFDDRSRASSVELWVAKRKPWLTLGAAMVGAVIAGAAITTRHDDG